MSLIETIKEKLLEARKTKNERAKSVLSVVLGDIQSQQGRSGQKGEITDQQAEKIVQKLIKSNQETMEAMTKDVGSQNYSGFVIPPHKTSSYIILTEENEILQALLPKACTKEEIKSYLISIYDKIIESKSDGQAIGVAMKFLATLEGSKDGKIVTEIVKEIRNG
jgi:uncharacterized protein YqeY